MANRKVKKRETNKGRGKGKKEIAIEIRVESWGGGMDDGKTWRIHLWYLFQRSKRPVDIPSIVKSI